MGHTPFDVALSPTERARAIVALCQEIDNLVPGEPWDAVRARLQAIEGIAMAQLPSDERRSMYAEIPVSVTGHCISWRFPKLPEWVFDSSHEHRR